MGPMIRAKAVEAALSLVEDAVARGRGSSMAGAGRHTSTRAISSSRRCSPTSPMTRAS